MWLEEVASKLHEAKSTFQVLYSAVMTIGRKAIEDGLEWLLESVGTGYDVINDRVQKDTAKQREQEEKHRRERAERVRKVREER